ncbi:MAG: hypothetical protein AAF570_15160, partial [Bacteroidota bacterium]
REFKKLEGLIIYDCPLKDLEFLVDYPNLKIFECQGNSLRTLEGIQHLKDLEEFSSHSNFAKDLTPLDSLLKLRVIKVYDNEVETLAPISHLQQVEHLNIARNKIKTLAPIANWKQLRMLSVYHCDNLTDISVVEDFHNLTDLNISFLPIPDFSLKMLDSIRGLQNLRVQGMVHSNKELNYIMYHMHLQQLTMGKNDNVTSIDSLFLLDKLKYLDIHSNNVADLSVLQKMPALVKLVAYRNKIEDLSPLLACTELRSLFIHENPVLDYGILYQMGYLQHLNLEKAAFNREQAIQLKKALRSTNISFM